MRFIKVSFLILFLVVNLYAREKVNVNLSNVEINDFIELISKIIHKNILINYKLTGKVNFVSSAPIYEDELMGILVSVLNTKGYTLVQNGSLYELVRSADASKSNVQVVQKGKGLYGSLMVTQAIDVKGENVDVVASKVRHLLSQNAKLITMQESNTLLVTDFPGNIKTIKEVIDQINVSHQNIVKVVHINYAEIKKLQANLTTIAASIFNTKINSEQVKILLDNDTNSLILVGSPQNVEKLTKLIAELDIESNGSKLTKIFELKNSDAKNVADSLNAIMSKQVYTDPDAKPYISTSQEINAVIVVGQPNTIADIKSIIGELDKEKYQVYVKAEIIQINKTNTENLGLKYGFAAGDISSSGLYAMSANFGDATLTSQASTSVLTYLGDIGSGAKSTFALGATLDFLKTHGASKSLSNPSILCVNNKESSIYVGKTISIKTGSVTGTTTSGVTDSYKREDVGLTLKIKPRVSSKEKVTLDVKAVLENVLDDGSNNATGQPVTSKQEVKTEAILRHGESIIIGGLVKNYNTSSKTKIPVLGNIPVLGALFRSTSTSTENDNIVVLLTPYVIDKSEELSKLQKDLGILAQIQKSYNDQIFKKIEKNKKENKQEDNETKLNPADTIFGKKNGR
ncbi:secretin N-terminal domain-containing protein [Sulfurimonas sp. HSL-1716]|uniref:secretin N-terminal domain-containing protein n=1 Tax=Hydrocurvibacter sulfurireducens TaxID=3131937 RepID=UPI0031F7BB03